jgi:hypothetical protein
MLDIGKLNLFRSVSPKGYSNGNWTISHIIDYYDIMGENVIYLNSDINTNLHLKCSVKKFENNSELIKVLENGLFRVSIIVIDFNSIDRLDIIRDITSLPIIVVAGTFEPNYHFIYSDKFDYFYECYSKIDYSMSFMSVNPTIEYVNDVKNDWVSTVEDIKIQLLRDKKIEEIFKK